MVGIRSFPIGANLGLVSGANLLLALESAEIPNQNQSQPTPTCDVKDSRFGVLTSWGPQIFIVSGELCECQDFSQGSGK